MPELQEIVREPTKKRSDILLTILISWLEKAEVVDSEGAGRLLLATLDGMALHYLSTFDNYPLSSMKHYLLQIVDQLLSNTDMRNFKRNS